MTKKSKKENTTKTAAKKVPFWLDPKAPLAQDFELADAVNKIIWKNMHLTVMEISWKLQMSGIFARFFLCCDPARVGEMLDLVNHDIDTAKAFFFKPPSATRDPERREAIRDCKIALKSQLIFVGVLSEVLLEDENNQHLTLYAIFRKPKTNKCFVAFSNVYRERAKNIACSAVPSTTSSPT